MTNKSGFEPIDDGLKPCYHPQHDPPTHLFVPPGSQYRHVCPKCEATVYIRPFPVRMESSQPTFSKGYSVGTPLDNRAMTPTLESWDK